MTVYRYSIFIPCYNRAGVLDKTLQSVADLEYSDFEAVIVNDGSQDDTDEIIRAWIDKNRFQIQYHRQDNGGKHVAHNRAVSMARGYFFITLDAGDFIIKDALTKLDHYWERIPEAQRGRFAGMSGLCLTEDGQVSGYAYPREVIDSNYFDIFRIVPLGGEKREAIKTEIMKKHLFPVYEGEKLVRPDLILRAISRDYKFRFINAPLEINVREKEGYTARIFRFRVGSPWSFYHYFREEINENYRYDQNEKIYYYYTRYIRYALHCNIGMTRQWREANSKWLWIAALPGGLLGWLKDKVKKRKLGLPG